MKNVERILDFVKVLIVMRYKIINAGVGWVGWVAGGGGWWWWSIE